MKLRPIDRDAPQPHPSQFVQQEFEVGFTFAQMTQRWHHHRVRRLAGVAASKCAQRLPRADFKQYAVGLFEKSLQAVGEPHWMPQMLGPIFRTNRLPGGDPSRRQIGHERDLWRLEPDPSQYFDERL